MIMKATPSFTNPKVSVALSDKDEGRKRLGMGVLIEKWLQTTDYKVFSDVANRNKQRGYNYNYP